MYRSYILICIYVKLIQIKEKEQVSLKGPKYSANAFSEEGVSQFFYFCWFILNN